MIIAQLGNGYMADNLTDPAAQNIRKGYPPVVSVRWHKTEALLTIVLADGQEIDIDPGMVQGLCDHPVSQLQNVEITPAGDALHFPNVDEDVFIPGLMEGLTGSANWMARNLGRKGGQARTSAKSAASRQNGGNGGRPPKSRGVTDPEPK